MTSQPGQEWPWPAGETLGMTFQGRARLRPCWTCTWLWSQPPGTLVAGRAWRCPYKRGCCDLPRASSRPSTQEGRAQKYRPRRLCRVGGPGSLLHGNPAFRSLPCPPGHHGLLEPTPAPLLRFPQPTLVPLTLGYPSISSPHPSSQRGHP